MSAEEIADKCGEAEDAIRGVTAGIRSGSIDASPMRAGFGKTACDYCMMRPVCRSCDPRLRRPTSPAVGNNKESKRKGDKA